MKKILYIFLALGLFSSCGKDFLDVEPEGVVSQNQLDDLAKSDPTNLTLITSPKILGAFSRLHDYSPKNSKGAYSHDQSGLQTIKIINELMADDVAFINMTFYQWDYGMENNQASYRRTSFIWKLFYTTIKDANDVIKVLEPVTDKSEKVSNDLAQAYFLRSFCYFNLIRHYQFNLKGHEEELSIPLVTDKTVGAQGKAKTQDVYNLILSDIESAVQLLKTITVSGKTTASYQTANGLAARIYLTIGEWEKAAAAAKTARGSIAPMSEVELLEKGFSSIEPSAVLWGYRDSKETAMGILSFNSHMSRFNYGYSQVLKAYKRIDTRLLKLIPDTDIRSKWFAKDGEEFKGQTCSTGDIKKFYDIDAEVNVADNIHMRVEEMYLIEAEALARQGGHDGEAQQVLNFLVSTRDNTFNTSLTGTALIDQILVQRRIELFGEGFRLMDLMRLNKGFTRDYEGSNHNSNYKLTVSPEDPRYLHAIPQSEIDTNKEID